MFYILIFKLLYSLNLLIVKPIENEVIEKKLRYNNVLEISSPVDRKEFIYVFHKSTEINKLLQRFLTFKTKFHFYDFFKYPRI